MPWRYESILERRRRESQEFQQFAQQRLAEVRARRQQPAQQQPSPQPQQQEGSGGGGGFLSGIGRAATGIVDMSIGAPSRIAGAAVEGFRDSGPTGALSGAGTELGRDVQAATSGREFQERLGVDTSYLDRMGERGLTGRIGAAGIDAVTAPSSLLLAGGGPALSAGIRGLGQGSRVGGLLARGGGAVTEPITRGGFGARFAGESALHASSLGAADIAGDYTDNPLLQMGAGLAGGVGSVAAMRRIGGAPVRPEAPSMRPEAPSVDEIGRAPSGRLGEAQIGGGQYGPFDLGDITGELTAMDSVMNHIGKLMGRPQRMKEVSPVFRRLRQQTENIQSHATATRLASERARQVFNVDERGIVEGFDATIQDIAARLPMYRNYLTPEQLQALDFIRRTIEPYADVARATGRDFGTRRDVMEGGFYIPRGRALEEGLDEPLRHASTPRRGKPGAFKAAEFDSMKEGIDAGWEYAPLAEVLESHVKSIGQDTLWRQTAEQLRKYSISTPAERIPGDLRRQRDELQRAVTSLRGRLATAERRAGLASKQEDELDRVLEQVIRGTPTEGFGPTARLPGAVRREGRRAEGLRGQAERLQGDQMRSPEGFPEARIEMPPTERSLAEAATRDLRAEEIEGVVGRLGEFIPDDLERVRFLDTAIGRTAKRAEELGKRGGEYAETASALKRQLDETEALLKEFMPKWRRAVEKARQTPQTEMTVRMGELSGHSFAKEIGEAIEREIEKFGNIRGSGADLLKTSDAVNQMFRGFWAAADISGFGIQGVLGAALDPVNYPRAVKVGLRAWSFGKDADRVGAKAALDFQKKLDRELPGVTVQDMVWSGLRQGGSVHEMAVGQGLGGAVGRVRHAPLIRQGNRSFGEFGDELRRGLWLDIAKRYERAGKNIADPQVMKEISNLANNMTGWSPNVFAGGAGQFIQFAPRFFQAQLEMASKALTHGGVEGQVARRSFMKMLGFGTAIVAAANHFSPDGLEPEEYLRPFRDSWFDPRTGKNPNFLRIRAAGFDTSLFGPWDSLMGLVMSATQAAGGLATGDVQGLKDGGTFFLRSKAAPTVSIAWDALTGEDFLGRPAGVTEPEWIIPKFFPFGAQELAGDTIGEAKQRLGFESDRELSATSVGRTATGLMGIKASPMTPSEKVQALLREMGDDFKVPDADGKMRQAESFFELNKLQRERFEEEHPEVVEELRQRGSDEGQQYQQRLEELTMEQEASDERLLAGEITMFEWKQLYNERRVQLREAANQLFEERDEDEEPESIGDLYSSMVREFTRADGTVDWDGVDDATSELTPEQREWITDNRALGTTDLSRRYTDSGPLRREYYELPKYRGYTGDEAREIDDLYDRARARLNLPVGARAPQPRMLRAIQEVAVELGIDDRVVRAARRRVLGLVRETEQRRRFRDQHPELDAFLGTGYLKPMQVAALRG